MTDENEDKADGAPEAETRDEPVAEAVPPDPVAEPTVGKGAGEKKRRKRDATAAEAAAATIEPPLTPRSPRAIGLALLAVVALVALDLWSKHWAEQALSSPRLGEAPAVCEVGPSGFAPYQRLREDPIVLFPGLLELEYAENCGSAFSLFAGMPAPLRHAIFYVAALMAVVVLSRMFLQGKGGRWFEAAVPMVIAGALGNFHDRVRFGYVVDFIHAHWEGHFDYPVFNVADCAVVIGVIALVIDSYRGREPATARPAASAKPA